MSTHRMCGIKDAHLAHEFTDGPSLIALTQHCPGVPHRPAGDVPPGPCWHDSCHPWSLTGEGANTRCELLAGHAGAHMATRAQGGEAVWTDEDAAQGSNRRSVALGDAEDANGAQKGADEAVHRDCAGDCAGPGCTGPAHGPQLATADDVIERRAHYADTPGGHADAATLKAEALELLRRQLTGQDNGSDETEGDAHE